MGIEALTTTASGQVIRPQSPEDWSEWVSASRTRNHAQDDPLLDWLDVHGETKGFQRDQDLPGYDERTDFSLFIMRKGAEFEAAAVQHISSLVPVVRISSDPSGIRDLKLAEETFAAMAEGAPLIHQGVLWDAESRTYGAPDLLVRSDILAQLWSKTLTPDEASVPAPALNGPWHYRVVDLKFTTLDLDAGEGPKDSGSAWAYKLQVFIYNRSVGRLQGMTPGQSYLLGRGWKQTVKGETLRSESCMDRLGPVPQDYASKSKGSLAAAVDEATGWIRKVRKKGAAWDVVPEPSVPELRPNMGNTSDQPWHAAKQRIGRELEDLTMLWQVGVGKRRDANRRGIYRWTDPACTAQSVGVNGNATAPILDALLDTNRSTEGPLVRPARVAAAEPVWREVPPLEFYVDFETVTDLGDDFSRIPIRGGQPMIFMIGCGHVEQGQWKFSCFTADSLTSDAEARIIEDWLSHMAEVRRRTGAFMEEPRCFHWSHAETSSLETAYNSAVARHPDRSWLRPNWFDLLKHVIKAEPVVVKGAFGFGLKSIANAMNSHGLISTRWEAGVADGLGAMVGAWWCAREAGNLGVSLAEIPLMKEIANYNEIDCKVMMEIVEYLRSKR